MDNVIPFRRMTDYEIRRYVFRPSPEKPIIERIAFEYIELYKAAGLDAPAVLKFSAGSSRAVISDNPRKTVIQPGASAGENIIAVINAELIAAFRRDVRAALEEKGADDYRRYKAEKRMLKINKRLNRKELRRERKEERARLRYLRKYGFEEYEDDSEETAEPEGTAEEQPSEGVEAASEAPECGEAKEPETPGEKPAEAPECGENVDALESEPEEEPPASDTLIIPEEQPETPISDEEGEEPAEEQAVSQPKPAAVLKPKNGRIHYDDEALKILLGED